ncbi:hypothetical protein niasHT_012014 [Heterodera trifolii]|uniref:Uncharacterized protein n=1 Tax=Heterodera trifolii TaxID=157864 RepID=A0ABD2L7X3_9BILA
MTNLKSILISHSVALMVYFFGRAGIIAEKFISKDQFAATNVVLQILMAFVGTFRRLFGHVLIIERFIATTRTESYESVSKDNGILSAVIELTIVTHHPLLKRRFLMLLKIIFRLKRNQIGEGQPKYSSVGYCSKKRNE